MVDALCLSTPPKPCGVTHSQVQASAAPPPQCLNGVVSARERGCQLRCDRLDHGVDDLVPAGEEIAAFRDALTTDEVAIAATGLAHQQAACDHVPRFQSNLVIAVNATVRNICQIKRRRTRAADILGLAEQGAGHFNLRVEMGALPVRKTRGQQCSLQIIPRTGADAPVIQIGAIASTCGEQFVTQRVVDDAMHRLAVFEHADGYAEMRKTAQVVVRAIERVDDPDVLALALGTGFLGEDGVAGKCALQLAYDLGLRSPIHFRSEIHALFLDNGKALDAIHVAQDDLACGTRGAHRHIHGRSGHVGSIGSGLKKSKSSAHRGACGAEG